MVRTCAYSRRRAAAAVELAVLMPFLFLVFAAGVDFARVYYTCVTVSNCARNGAVYGSQRPENSTDTAGIQAAALQDAGSLAGQLTATSVTGTDTDGNPDVTVTVTCPFSMITQYVSVPQTITITRSVQMRVTQAAPNNS
jgi:Flp pilus assembly protein TadG